MHTGRTINSFWREHGPVLLVVLAVVLLSTVAGAYFNYARQADAEEASVPETPATLGGDGTQTLAIREWGVQVAVPVGEGMSRLLYAKQTDSSIGISTEDLKKFGTECRAGNSGLGSLTRVPAGTFASANKAGAMQYVTTLGAYDFGFIRPGSNACATMETGQIINREQSVLSEALSTLSLISQ